jgi:hypothetical protein
MRRGDAARIDRRTVVREALAQAVLELAGVYLDSSRSAVAVPSP